jgi:endonuclease/exonuclease/phosphatase family metal-dependent hydrolase
MRQLITAAVACLLGVAVLAEGALVPAAPESAQVIRDDVALVAKKANPRIVVASLNALGDSHTRPGGHAAFLASGTTRTRNVVRLLGRHRIDVVGLQEFQPAQHAEFRRRAGSTYSVFPGRNWRQRNKQNAIAWRTSTFSLVEGFTRRMTYMGGRKVPMPVVRLRHRATGRHIYVISVHNAPGRNGTAQRHRNAAVKQQVALTRRLLKRGIPVFMTGDMNDRERYFCPYTARTPMHAAAGGTNRRGCRPPPGRIARVDWVFGSRDVKFSRYRFIKSSLVRRTTDHPLITARATLRG